jgi:ornithine cyclodeaminase
LEDHVALDMLLDFARDLGVGKHLHIESVADDPHNPYEFALRPPNGRAMSDAELH